MENEQKQTQNEDLPEKDLSICNLNHRKKKALLRKLKRKEKRQAVARERDKKLEEEEVVKKSSPSYLAKIQQDEERIKAELLRAEAESKYQRELWEWNEEIYKEKLKKKQEQEERERLNRLEIERKIKEEWEERQRKEKEEEEERKKKKEKQEEMLRKAREGENKESDWHNPLAPVQYGQERVVDACPFFAKVGACRFGDRCSRAHTYPETGRTILFTNMFRHFQLDQGLCEEYDTDIVLEYEDSEVYQKFSEFYEDVLPELKAVGRVTQFKVCCNFQPHLRGNVYVSFSKDDDALKTFAQFNARWYGGKQLSAQFVEIPSWKRAICGLFGKGRCPKGKECNFLHVFRNPTNEFAFADKDMDNFTPRHRNDRHDNRFNNNSYSQRSRRYSRSPSRSHRKQRSRSSDRRRSRSKERHRSRSKERRHNYNDYHRNRRRSRYSRSRSRGRNYSRSRSRSREYSRSRTSRRSRSKERTLSKSSAVRKSRSKSRSSSNSPERLKRSRSRSISKDKYYTKRSRSKERLDGEKRARTESSSTFQNDRHSSSKSPVENHHKKRKRKHKDKRRKKGYSSSEENSDFEEVWVEKKTNNGK